MDHHYLDCYISELHTIIAELDHAETNSTAETGSLQSRLSSLECRMRQEKAEIIDFKSIIDASSDGIYISDQNAVIRYVNAAYANHTGLTPEELIGKSGQQLLDEGVFRQIVTPEVIKTKQQRVLTGYIRTVNDRDIYGYSIVKPIFNELGEVAYVVVTLYDPARLRGRYHEFSQLRNQLQPSIQVRQDSISEGLEPVIGSSKVLKEVYDIAKRVARTDATILIQGESGVGKEGLADFICTNSPRKNKPFIKINCTAIPADLLESELFGYEQGAFTGANRKGKIGLFEQANYGTILLDEIGDLSMQLQAKLLRVIQQKELIKLGGSAPIKLEIRIIASTNANLKQKIQDGSFREDLYYRLSTIPIHIPSLRERREDIRELITYFMDYYGQMHHRLLELSDEHMMIFERYDWPGNIRQLRNVVEYLVVCADDDYVSSIEPLLRILEFDCGNVKNAIPTLAESMNSYEKMIISQALKKSGGVRKAAEVLGIDPATISRKIKRYGIDVLKREN